MKVTLLHPLPAIHKGKCGTVCRDGPNWILGPPIWSRTKDKEERHRKPDRHKWERHQRNKGGGVKPRGEGQETQGETDRTGRHRREASTRDGEIGERGRGEAETRHSRHGREGREGRGQTYKHLVGFLLTLRPVLSPTPQARVCLRVVLQWEGFQQDLGSQLQEIPSQLPSA